MVVILVPNAPIMLLRLTIAMQSILDLCESFSKLNDLNINLIKFDGLLFKPWSHRLYFPPVTIGSEKLMYISETKYLGFNVSENWHGDSDMLRQMRSLIPNPIDLWDYWTFVMLMCKLLRTIVLLVIVNCYGLMIKKSTYDKIRVNIDKI